MYTFSLQYKNFIDVFEQANKSIANPYIFQDCCPKGTYTKYTCTAFKDPSFKIKQIADVSQKCLDYFAPDTCPETLEDRVSYLRSLQNALKACASRIEDSIKNRWWYCILHLFGYQAKCPKNIQKLIDDVDTNKFRIFTDQMRIPAKHERKEAEQKEVEQQKELIETESIQKEELSDDKLGVLNPSLYSSMPALEPVDEIGDEIIEEPTEPFDFANLPENAKHGVYIQLTLKDMLKMREVSKASKGDLDGLRGKLSQLIVLAKFLNKPSKLSKIFSAVNYQTYVNFVIQHPNLNKSLAADKKFRETFFAHFAEANRPSIVWCSAGMSKSVLTNLIDLFFEYASDEQLTTFLKKDACAVSNDLVKGYLLNQSNFTTLLFDSLNPERIERLSALPHIEECIFLALACANNSNKQFIMTTFYQKLPDSVWWTNIKIPPSGYSKLLNIRAYVVALEMQKLLKNTSVNNEKEISALANSLLPLLDLFSHPRADMEVRVLIHMMRPCFQTLDELKVIAFTHAVTLGSKNEGCPRYAMYIKALMATNDPKVFEPMLKEYVRLNCKIESMPDAAIEDLMPAIKTKEQAVAFVQACQALPEPLKTMHLRCLAHGSGRTKISPFEQLEEVFTETGLDFSHYPPLEREVFSTAFFYQSIVDQLQAVATPEELQSWIDKLVVSHSSSYHKYLRFLAGGVELPNGQILKIALADEMSKQVFENKELLFDSFNSLIPLDEFLQE